MRILRLDLLRYGHLADVALDFPRAAALHVVLGPNEAGKSTALEAIGDALFGIPERSERGFLHGNPRLRIGITLEARDGARAAFLRRKGRQDTLRDAEDAPVPEQALRRFLGGATRALFERGFGLDGARLREGGRELLRSGGETGESLLAGMGLLHLRAALDRLEEEARALHGDGRGRRRFAAALAAWQDSRRAAEDAAVKPRDWEEAEAAEAALRGALEAAHRSARDLAAEASRLQRLRRVRSRLAELDQARAEHAGLADAPRLPADAEARLRAAEETLRAARQDAGREAEAARHLAAEQAGLVQDGAVLALQDAIDALAARLPVVVQAEQDLPAVRAAIARHRAAVEEAARDLGTPAPPEALRDAVPPDPVRRRAQRLLGQRAALLAARDAATEALARGRRQLAAAEAALAEAPAPPNPAPLRRAIEAARGEGPLDRELERAAQAAARAAQAVATALAALPHWRGDAATLAACPVPLAAEAEALAQRLAAAEATQAAAATEMAAIEAEIAALEAALEALAGDGAVPTRDAVLAAREARDAAWRLLRRAAEAERDALADRIEALRDAADRLADRRAEEAERVADHAAKTARRAALLARRAAASASLGAADARLAEAQAAWRALWAPAGIEARAPAAMAEWRRARAEVLRLDAAAAEAGAAREAVAARRDAAREALAAMLPDPPPGNPPLATLLAAAEARCAAAEEAAKRHRSLAERREDAARQLPELGAAAAGAQAGLAALEGAWQDAAAALGLAPTADAEAMEAALAAWSRIAEAARAWRTEAQRVADMEATTAGFAAATRDLLARLPDMDGAEAPALAVPRLARRLAAARALGAQAEALARRIATHETAAAEAGRRGAAAAEAIAGLSALAGAADIPALEAAIGRARRRDALAAEIGTLARILAEQGDGLDEAALRAEAAGIDADAAQARLAEIGHEQAACTERIGQLGGDLARAGERLAALRRGRDAAAHAQAAEQALAEAREAAERYARIHLARSLLRAGIERFRAERQTPLLRAAGGHFALLTGGRYARLGVDQDAQGRALLQAVRDDGTECAVEALSEGTRDQLYLALRVALVESAAAEGEPLPFIADDLLVHFDDARAAAAIALLARLGAATQVILFTHHDHIAAMAQRQAGVALQRLPPLAAPAALTAA